jgi:hypothetical protein
MQPTTTRWGFDLPEMATTAVAVVVSSGAYVRYGAPYLALGVVGDSLGFTVLLIPLLLRGRRLRHEALVCLVGIGLVHLLGWTWPLAVSSVVWWSVFAVDLLIYVGVRHLALRGALDGPTLPRSAPPDAD